MTDLGWTKNDQQQEPPLKGESSMMDDATLLRLVASNWEEDWPGSTTADRLRTIADRIDDKPGAKRRREVSDAR
jgi:hypothetical protein